MMLIAGALFAMLSAGDGAAGVYSGEIKPLGRAQSGWGELGAGETRQ